MTPTDPAAVARVVAIECARVYHDALGERLAAAYLLGSLAHGGYCPAVSDIDLAIVLTDTHDDDPATIATTSETLRGQSSVHRKLSVFWGSLTALRDGSDDGRFPAVDRLELVDHGVLLLGDDIAHQVTRPTPGELLLESTRFALNVLATDEVIAEFREPHRLLADPVRLSKAVLFPVRFLYTNTVTTTGRAATNAEAISWYLNQPQPVAASLVRLAARVRAGDPLNPAHATTSLAEGLLPLYRHYLDDQIARLRHADAPADLVAAVTRWRQRLT